MGFETEFGYEVGEEFVEDFFGGFERVVDVAVGVEELLDYEGLARRGDLVGERGKTNVLGRKSFVGRGSCLCGLGAPFWRWILQRVYWVRLRSLEGWQPSCCCLG